MNLTTKFENWRTTGLDKKLIKPVLTIQSNWICINGFFCLPGTDCFLSGFVMNHKPYGSEIYSFIIPLFTGELEFHLNYTDQTPPLDEVIYRKGKTPSEIAYEFLNKVTPVIEKSTVKDSIRCFLDRIEENEYLLRNTRIRFDYALALILNTQFEEAKNHLITVSNSEWEKRTVPLEATCAEELARLLNKKPKVAVEMVNSYLQENKTQIELFTNIAR